jgi:hypothetical protein
LRKEYIRIQEKEIAKGKEVQNKDGQNGKFYESLQKESKFMAEHIKRLSG